MLRAISMFMSAVCMLHVKNWMESPLTLVTVRINDQVTRSMLTCSAIDVSIGISHYE